MRIRRIQGTTFKQLFQLSANGGYTSDEIKVFTVIDL